MTGVSLYWKEEDKNIFGCDNVLDAVIPQGLPVAFIKAGKWVTDTEYLTVYHEAFNAYEAPNENMRT